MIKISVFISDLHLFSETHDYDAFQRFLDKVYSVIEEYNDNKVTVKIYCVGDVLSGAEVYGKWMGQQAYNEVLQSVSAQTLGTSYIFKKIAEKVKELTDYEPSFHILRGTHEKVRGQNYAWQLVTELQASGLNADYLGTWKTIKICDKYYVFAWHSTGSSSYGYAPAAIRNSNMALLERRDNPYIKDVIIAHRHATGYIGLTQAYRLIQLGGFQQYDRAPNQRQMGGYVYISTSDELLKDFFILVGATQDPMLDIHNRVKFAEIFKEACEDAVKNGRISIDDEKVENPKISKIVDKEKIVGFYNKAMRYYFENVPKYIDILLKLINRNFKENNEVMISLKMLERNWDPALSETYAGFKNWKSSSFNLGKDGIPKHDLSRSNIWLKPFGVKLIWSSRLNDIIILMEEDKWK